MRVTFEKWQGLGNDFVLVAGEAAARLEGSLTAELVRSLCDRRFGIGADGVLLVGSGAGGARMTVYNADGSRPEMCGNGLRCVAAHLAGERGASAALCVLTDAGERRCAPRALGDGLFEVRVEMGAARLAGELRLSYEGTTYGFALVDVGNPHAVGFQPCADASIDRLARLVSASRPEGSNVEFCSVRPGEPAVIDVLVWERGVGRTLACGTGACAVAAAACASGRAAYGAPVRVVLPGGELSIEVAPGSLSLAMTGPARRVFTGEIALP